MTDENSAVPSPKLGRVVNPQKPNVETPYIFVLDRQGRKNELRRLKAAQSNCRAAMSELQRLASKSRRSWGFVPDDVRVALKDSRTMHRSLAKEILIISASLKGEEEE